MQDYFKYLLRKNLLCGGQDFSFAKITFPWERRAKLKLLSKKQLALYFNYDLPINALGQY